MSETTRTNDEQAARDEAALVCGRQVQYDHSGGQGHCWRDCDPGPDVRLEIEAEIVDGGREECDDFTASNGCHYRWRSGPRGDDQ